MVLLRNSLLYLLATGINKGWLILLVPFLTRVLSAEEFGNLGIALVVVSMLAVVVGLNPFLFIIARFNLTSKDDLASYIYHILLIAAVSCVLIVAAFVAFPVAWQRYGIDIPVFLVLAVVALNRVILNVALAILQMEKKALQYLGVSGFLVLLILTLLGALAVASGLRWTTLFVAELAAGTVVTALLTAGLKRRGYIRSGFRWPAAKDVMKFSLPLVPHVLALWTMNAVDRFFLAEMVDMKVVGLYTAAYTLALGISLLHESLQRAWQPFFFEYMARGDSRLKEVIVRYTWLYYLGSLVLFFVYVELIRLFLPLLLGAEYRESMAFIPLLVLAYTVLGMYRVVSGYLYHDNRTAALAATTMVAAALNVVLNYLLIPVNGALGAAQATLAAFVLSFVIVKLIVVTRYDMPWIAALRYKRHPV